MLYNVLGFLPCDLSVYMTAFTHRSYSGGKTNRKVGCNERLEFLGDAIIDAVVSDLLYSRFKKEREGFLTKSRSNLVCRETLNNVALSLGLDKLVVAHNTGHQHNSHIYGNAFEAFIGAIYIDKGYNACKRFLLERVFDKIVNVDVAAVDINFKSRLIELSQKKHIPLEFRLVEERCDAGGQFFESEVFLCGNSYGSGCGFSKRESQQNAAKVALSKLNTVEWEALEQESACSHVY